MASTLALVLYSVLFALAAVAVWRRPLIALYLFLVGLAAHNLVMALLWGAGVRGNSLEAIAAWKDGLLAVALLRVALDALRARQLAFRPGVVDLLAAAFGCIVAVYAVVPQGSLGGLAGPSAVGHALRHDLLPVAAYFVGRSVVITRTELRRLAWALLGAGSALAAFGLIEEYTVPVGWWRHSGAVGYFHDQLGFRYHGPGGLPENFAFNSSDGLFRRLVSTFISPLATAYVLVAALLLAPWRRLAIPLAVLCAVGLLFTVSRSALAGLVVGLVVLALASRRSWPLAGALVTVALGLAFGYGFTSIAPRTHFFKSDLAYQQAYARAHPGATRKVFSANEPSIRSHLSNLRDGLKTVARHPQGYGLGNAGATAARFEVPLKAGESNYTEIGVETGLVGMLLFLAWNLALFAGLLRTARREEAPPETAGMAAAFAAVLVVSIQTDAFGIPWLGICLWWLGGTLLAPCTERMAAAAHARPAIVESG
ncbi:MAG: hypothetical protein C5B48_05205 [Candidatus Rokuibacteriota bacterium]|nr:MAG: hypothetical protein C5B48_05205 [Candidatus Rokubacteria bacterium]